MKIFLFTYIYSRYFNICLQKYMAGCLYLYMFVYSFGWSRYKSRTEGEKHLNRFKGLCFVYSCSSLWGEYGWVSKFARMASTFSLLVSWWSSVFYWLTMPKRIEVNKWEFVWRNGCRWVSESSRHSLSINNCLLLFYEALMFYVLLQPLWSRAYPIQMPESIPQLREIAHTHTPHQETSPTAWRCYHPSVACALMIHRRTTSMGKGLGFYMGPKISMMDFSGANSNSKRVEFTWEITWLSSMSLIFGFLLMRLVDAMGLTK